MDNYWLYVVSDSIGETAELVARAAISQFADIPVEQKRYTHANTEEKIAEIIDLAKADNAVILYTLAEEHLKNHMCHSAKEANIVAVDVLTPSVAAIASCFSLEPTNEVGNLRKLDEVYFKRVAAVEFAVQYDDGKDPRGFKKADLVLLGVSRTSKTPLSMYLANKNILVANLPLVPEVPLPKEIFEIPKEKIVGLTIRPQNLNEIRSERLKIMGAVGVGDDYARPNRLLEELDYAAKVYRRLGCRVLDVTNKAVEETAGNILEFYKEALHE
jgi:hypothetical protein